MQWRVDFRTIRFAGDQNHLGGVDEIPRQLRRPVGHHRVAIQLEVQQLVLDGVLEEVVSFVDNDAGGVPVRRRMTLTAGSTERM
jgi:hypothetical protein